VGGKSEPAGTPSEAGSIRKDRNEVEESACRLAARRGGPRG